MSEKPKPNQSRPEVQVEAKPRRRRFTAQYKLSILEQVDACTKPGEVGALLRREGLYSSHLATWRDARDQGQLAALQPRKRGRKAKEIDPRDERIAELEKQLAAEQARCKRAEALVELQKKLATLLENLPKDETP
jgi:transposase